MIANGGYKIEPDGVISIDLSSLFETPFEVQEVMKVIRLFILVP